jgi:hypothetical protein
MITNYVQIRDFLSPHFFFKIRKITTYFHRLDSQIWVGMKFENEKMNVLCVNCAPCQLRSLNHYR